MSGVESSALSLLRAKLEALYNQLLNGDAASGSTAKEIVEALRTDIRPHERPLAASLTLQSEYSLLHFLHQSVKHESRKEHADARAVILDYLVRLVNEKRQIRPLSALHAVGSCVLCFMLFCQTKRAIRFVFSYFNRNRFDFASTFLIGGYKRGGILCVSTRGAQ
jgi:hypothetical protein